jgi:hypothetical protein
MQRAGQARGLAETVLVGRAILADIWVRRGRELAWHAKRKGISVYAYHQRVEYQAMPLLTPRSRQACTHASASCQRTLHAFADIDGHVNRNRPGFFRCPSQRKGDGVRFVRRQAADQELREGSPTLGDHGLSLARNVEVLTGCGFNVKIHHACS